MDPEINDHIIKHPVTITLAIIGFELKIIEGANPLILNSYYWITYEICFFIIKLMCLFSQTQIKS
jgi:hypothetical protein